MPALALVVMSLALLASGIAAAETPRLQATEDRRELILHETATVEAARLTLEGQATGPSLRVERIGPGRVSLVSRWPLMPGAAYTVAVTTADGVYELAVTLPMPRGAAPGVAQVSPAAPMLPENLLRLHLDFETPMARGQVRDHVRLLRADGSAVRDAFLDLGVELWSADQRRLTLLLDPGRIKQGVGPNLALGAPLRAGERYTLEVSTGMRDAHGRPIAEPQRHAFMAGPPIRTPIDLAGWTVETGASALLIDFGRPMDVASVVRYVSVVTGDGSPLSVRTRSGQPAWDISQVPSGSRLRIVAHPLLEDAAGNTPCVPFDVEAGGATGCPEGARLEIDVVR